MESDREVLYLKPEKIISDGLAKKSAVNPAVDTSVQDEIRVSSTPVAPESQLRALMSAERSGMSAQNAGLHGGATPDLPTGRARAGGNQLDRDLNHLAGLIANITESFTVAIFLSSEFGNASLKHRPSSRNNADGSREIHGRSLEIRGAHSLSRDFKNDARVGYGCGLVGWTAENGVRISVCPFEHDASTLLYYSQDQGLKSFIAVPVYGQGSTSSSSKQASQSKQDQPPVIGVIACDSKKSYAFAKITEKILLDCAGQVASLVALHEKTKSLPQQGEHGETASGEDFSTIQLGKFLDSLRECEEENLLLQRTAELPASLIEQEAVVVMTTSEGGVGRGRFYTGNSGEEAIGNKQRHHLLELVCRHKKVICGERSVHARHLDNKEQRSFLSIPIRVLGREAGSINLISKPREAFHAGEIAMLEEIARNVGKELERMRLRDRYESTDELLQTYSWKHFAIKGSSLLSEASSNGQAMSLLRLSLDNLQVIEQVSSPDIATLVTQKIIRLVEQLKPREAVSCMLYGFDILVLLPTNDADSMLSRLRRLVEKSFYSAPGSADVSKLVLNGLLVTSSHVDWKDKDIKRGLKELIRETIPHLEGPSFEGSSLDLNFNEQPANQPLMEKVANAGTWK